MPRPDEEATKGFKGIYFSGKRKNASTVWILWTWRLQLTATNGIGTTLPCPQQSTGLLGWEMELVQTCISNSSRNGVSAQTLISNPNFLNQAINKPTQKSTGTLNRPTQKSWERRNEFFSFFSFFLIKDGLAGTLEGTWHNELLVGRKAHIDTGRLLFIMGYHLFPTILICFEILIDTTNSRFLQFSF